MYIGVCTMQTFLLHWLFFKNAELLFFNMLQILFRVLEQKRAPQIRICNLQYCLYKTKESYSTANEGKRQFNRSIIYYLNIVPIVNDSFWNSFWKKKVELPGLELTAGEVFRSCQSWTLYHCATKLRQFLGLKFSLRM